MSFLKDLALAFSPNRAISKRTALIVIIFQITVPLAIWVFGLTPVIPKPAAVLAAFAKLWRDGLSVDLGSSFLTNLKAIGLSTIISLVLSYLTVTFFFRLPVWAISKGRFLGLAGLTFLFTILIGGGVVLKVSLMVFGMSVFFITSMAAIVAETPREEYDYARTLRMNRWRVVWEVVILGKLDQAFEILRQNAAIGWMMLTMVEGIVRYEGGLGALLLNENKHMKLPEVFAVQILILIIGMGQDYFIGVMKNIICPYARLAVERR